MIMHKISYIICKKYKCRHGEILVNATGLSPVEKSCGFESHWRHKMPVWWNGRHDSLRNCSRKGCRFESYYGHL